MQDFDNECLSDDMNEIYHQVQQECTELDEEGVDAEAERRYVARFGHTFEQAVHKIKMKYGVNLDRFFSCLAEKVPMRMILQ